MFKNIPSWTNTLALTLWVRKDKIFLLFTKKKKKRNQDIISKRKKVYKSHNKTKRLRGKKSLLKWLICHNKHFQIIRVEKTQCQSMDWHCEIDWWGSNKCQIYLTFFIASYWFLKFKWLFPKLIFHLCLLLLTNTLLQRKYIIKTFI